VEGSSPRRLVALQRAGAADPGALALAGIGEAIAVAAQEILADPIELAGAPPTGGAVHYTGADEIGPLAAEPTGHGGVMTSVSGAWQI
jgi:hypothetical protein